MSARTIPDRRTALHFGLSDERLPHTNDSYSVLWQQHLKSGSQGLISIFLKHWQTYLILQKQYFKYLQENSSWEVFCQNRRAEEKQLRINELPTPASTLLLNFSETRIQSTIYIRISPCFREKNTPVLVSSLYPGQINGLIIIFWHWQLFQVKYLNTYSLERSMRNKRERQKQVLTETVVCISADCVDGISRKFNL